MLQFWRFVRVPLALFLVAFSVGSILLARSVQGLRADVDAVVGSLRSVDALHQSLLGQSLRGNDARVRAGEAREELARVQVHLGDLESGKADERKELLREVLAALGGAEAGTEGRIEAATLGLERLEDLLRSEASGISRQLGDRWDLLMGILAISLLAGLGVFLLAEALVRERHRAEELRHLASTDLLTGLPNRAGIQQLAERELERASREGTACGVLLVDLDMFKQVNDRFGHRVGDDVLRGAAERMQRALRRYDMVGRYGGDEFLVLIPRCDETRLRSVAARLSRCLEPAIESPRGTHQLSLSIGGVCSAGAAPVADLVHRADRALYRAKKAGRNRCVLEPVESTA